MRRKHLNRIGVWQKTAIDDGAGGNTTGETQLGSSWCDIKTIPRTKYTDYGLNSESQAIRIRLRYRDDLDYFTQDLFFKYQGKDWIPTSIERKDLEDYNIEVVAIGDS